MKISYGLFQDVNMEITTGSRASLTEKPLICILSQIM